MRTPVLFHREVNALKNSFIPPVNRVGAANRLSHKNRSPHDLFGSRSGSSAPYSSLFDAAMSHFKRDANQQRSGPRAHPPEEAGQELDGLLQTLEKNNTDMLSAIGGLDSGPSKTCIVPTIGGLSLHTAIGRLKMAQLKMGAIRKQYSAQVPAGYIISQTPEQGGTVYKMTGVSVIISKGPPPEAEKYDIITGNDSTPFFQGNIDEDGADEFGKDGVFIQEETATL